MFTETRIKMKRYLGYFLFFFFVVLFLGVGIKEIVKHTVTKKDDVSVMAEVSPKINAICDVYQGSLDSTYIAEATVLSDDECFAEYTSAQKQDKVKCKVQLGDAVKKGQLLFVDGKKNIRSKHTGRIVSMKTVDDKISIKMLDESKLYINLQIPYEYYKQITYHSLIKVDVDEKLRKGVIKYIDYKVVDEMVSVDVAFDGYIMPGRQATVQIALQKTPNMLYVPTAFVMNTGDSYYCNIVEDLENNLISEKKIQVGNLYTVLEDGESFEYYEIADGLSVGDQIATMK